MIIEFIYCTGCTSYEFIYANRNNIDYELHTIFLEKKNGSIRTAFLSDLCIQLLDLYLNDRIYNDSFVFHHYHYHYPYSPMTNITTVNDILKREAKKVGIDKNVNVSILRNSTCVNAYHQDMPIQNVKEIMGYQSIEAIEKKSLAKYKGVQDSHRRFIDEY